MASVLALALGLDSVTSRALSDDLDWLLDRRNEGVHPYSESELPREHPSGVNTSVEALKFNAMESRRANDIAMMALALAANPPNPANGWVRRWTSERAPYQTGVVARLRTERLP